MKIKEEEINWIKDAEEINSKALNRQPEELLENLGSVQSSNIINQNLTPQNLNVQLEEADYVFSQQTLSKEVMSLIQQLQDINTDLENRNLKGTLLEETRTNKQNKQRFIQGGNVVQNTGYNTKDVMSQKAVTDYMIGNGQPAPEYTQGNGINIANDGKINVKYGSNLSIEEGKLTGVDTIYTQESNSAITKSSNTFNVSGGQGITINNQGIQLNKISSVKNSPQYSLKGLGLGGEKWKKLAELGADTGTHKMENTKDYPIMIAVKYGSTGYVKKRSFESTRVILKIPDTSTELLISKLQPGDDGNTFSSQAFQETLIVPQKTKYEIVVSGTWNSTHVYILE